jgi:glucosamine--fructose-6-phosphate aminotransferase (isomerizing)
MYSELPADIRDAHPYHMYDEIKLQPEAVVRSLKIVEDMHSGGAQDDAAHTDLVGLIARSRRLFITGCGTSFHAAQIGAWFFDTLSPGIVDARSMQAYELITYGPSLRPGDVVIGVSHSGTTFMTLQAMERARQAGAETILLTGFPESPGTAAGRHSGTTPTHVLPTGYPEERSWAHTVSYTAALASLAALANLTGDRATGPQLEANPGRGNRLDLKALREVIAGALQLEEMAHRMAATLIINERYREPAPIVVVGAGPNAVTAHEAVLKLLETSYMMAAAFELEQMLHGPLAAVSHSTLFILIAPPGASTERAAELARAAHRIGVVPVVLAGEKNAAAFDDAHRFILPEVPEALSPIPYVIPLQLFSYFLAIGNSLNPDLIHRDDDQYRLAAKEYR